ncbi:myosin-11-like isoform X2 [Bufo gargarizans]|uniref:myosin-11-like isoform X2 n=1 Tax=Bufo gargarizans TaxID=30331 RepID=UPI001CF3E3DE|nr:myosin-11-like isoform X2 [Bufo gargarizans]
MAGKAHQSILVNETHTRRKEAEEAVIEYRNKTDDLEEDMAIERQQFIEETDRLTAEIAKTQKKTEEQDARNAEKKVSLSQRRSVLFDVEEKVTTEKENISSIKGKVLLLQASHGRLTNKLDIEKKQSMDTSNKIDILELRMANKKEDFYKQSNTLKDEISKLDEQMKTAEIVHESLVKTHKDLKLKYQTASAEEDRQHAMKRDTAKQLEQSRSALDEKQELLGKLKMELTEMEGDTENLLESMRISMGQLATHVEEFRQDLTTERQKRMSIQIKKGEVTKEIELWKLSEEGSITEMKKRIQNGQNKKVFLTNEGSRLQGEIEKWDKEICSINEEQTKASKEYSRQVQSLKDQIKNLEEKLKISISSLENEQQELAKNIPIMKAAEDTYNKEHDNYEDIKKKASAMKSKQKSLVGSITTITKDIEANIKLKQNAQYKEDISAIISESQKHLSATSHLEKYQASLIEHLHEGWDQDKLVCGDFSERDQEILDSIMELLRKISNREEKVGYLNGILHEKYIGLSSLLEIKTGKKGNDYFQLT